jgi:8-oxo-dGTP diphosphatase
MDERLYCAVKALIFKDDRFLIIKRSLKARGDPYTWELPGGGVEFRESPEAALVREVKEETGLEVGCLFPISTWTFMKTENTQVIGINYLCAARRFTDIVLSPEHDELTWIKESEITNYRFAPGIAEEFAKWNWEVIKSLATERGRR